MDDNAGDLDLVRYWGQDLGRLPKIEEAVVNSLVCPICLKYALYPTSHCRNGHVICHSCQLRVGDLCPVCRTRRGRWNSVITEMLSNLFTIPCSYLSFGCRYEAKGILAEIHQARCTFAIRMCPFKYCMQSYTKKGWFDHLFSEHNVGFRRSNEIEIFRVDDFINKNEDRTHSYCLIENNEDLFMVFMRKKAPHYSWLFFPMHHYLRRYSCKAFLYLGETRISYELRDIFENFDVGRCRSGAFKIEQILEHCGGPFTEFGVKVFRRREIL